MGYSELSGGCLYDLYLSFLCHVTFLSISFDVLTPTIVWDSKGRVQDIALYYDGTVDYIKTSPIFGSGSHSSSGFYPLTHSTSMSLSLPLLSESYEQVTLAQSNIALLYEHCIQDLIFSAK